MENVNQWSELVQLLDAPFLAINVTNSDKEKLLKNENLLSQRKTGDWDLRKSVFNSKLKGRKIVLLFKRGVSRMIYLGTIKRLKQNGVNKKNEPRYEIEVEKEWQPIAETISNFKEFFSGFKVGAGDTYLWACEESLDISDDGNNIVDPILEPKHGSDIEGSFLRRVGHHIFVNALKRVWGSKCALTELSAPRLVQACHIIPWGEASSQQKVSADNGLLLCAHLHALFDANLIGFSREGELLIDKDLAKELVNLVVVGGRTKLSLRPTEIQSEYLNSHAMKNPDLVRFTY